MRLVWISIIIYTASMAVNEMTGWPLPAIAVVLGVATTFYTTAAGCRAVVWSDFVAGSVAIGWSDIRAA